MIFCIGEILADMIGDIDENVVRFERKAGGAPFNVACALRKWGAEVRFFGSVGDDLIGKFLKEYAVLQGLRSDDIRVDKRRNTTLAFVQLDKNGERSFCFYRRNTADVYINEIPEEELKKANIVYVGSLMLSEEYGRKYAEDVMSKAKKLGKVIAFDVNYRSDIFRDEQAAVAVYKKYIELADIVKFSEDEAELFTHDYICKDLNDKLVCTSLGGKGSRWLYNGRSGDVGAIRVTPIDTTGAGDAFFAGVLYSLNDKKFKGLTDGQLNAAFKFGNICGALNTLGKGAVDHLPTLKEIVGNMRD